jgi:hypothetical protein
MSGAAAAHPPSISVVVQRRTRTPTTQQAAGEPIIKRSKHQANAIARASPVVTARCPIRAVIVVTDAHQNPEDDLMLPLEIQVTIQDALGINNGVFVTHELLHHSTQLHLQSGGNSFIDACYHDTYAIPEVEDEQDDLDRPDANSA